MEMIVAKFGQEESYTYADILDQGFLDESERMRIMGESALGHAAVLLTQRGDHDTSRLLLDVIQVAVEPSEYEYDLWLEVAPEHMGQFEKNKVERIRDACIEVSKRFGYEISWLGVREVITYVGPEWREHLRQQFSAEKRPTNHARRVRNGPARYAEDWLSFTNAGELAVYRALKKLQESLPRDNAIGIFPLAGGRIPGKTWEPDVLVTYKGRAGVLEIDGPHHNARRAMDTSRDHLWLDAGVAFVDRIPVETLSDPEELTSALRRFLRRLSETR